MDSLKHTDSQIDALIELRAQEAQEAEPFDPWQAVEHQQEQLREAARQEWVLHHRNMAALHARIAEEHQEKAERLIRDGGEQA